MVFLVVMYGCESRTVKKAERRRIDAFELLSFIYIPTLTSIHDHWKNSGFVINIVCSIGFNKCIYYMKKVKVKLLSCVRLFETPWTVAYQAPPSMGFSRQECWSGLPFPSPGDLPNPGIEPGSPALQADSLPSEPPGKTSEDTESEVAQSCLTL